MGQYYRVITQQGQNHFKIYNRNIIVGNKQEYTPAKLTEHSWWLNPFVNAICESIYKTPKKVVWLGDYSMDFMDDFQDGFNGLSRERIKHWDKIVWGKNDKSIAIKDTTFTLDGKYLLNHSKRTFVNGSTFFKRNLMKSKDCGEWCMHPLPLLTCIGNGCGGGDYRYPTDDASIDLIGTWAFDEISVEDEKPTNYKEIKPIFKEKGWEE